jgi:hypothetical protein
LNDSQDNLEVLQKYSQHGREGCVAIALFDVKKDAKPGQGSALPGMCISALLTALDACNCSKSVVTSSEAVQVALAQFGYDVQVDS